jgi:RHS repeat-associated protein
MSGISSKSAGSLKNKFKFNGKEEQRQEFSDGSGLEWLDFGHRMYDNQISRFFTLDRMVDSFPSFSPYQYARNNPILYMDVIGDSAWSVTREWNADDVKGFADYAQKKLNEMVNDKNIKLDCADAALTILIGYASENGLALQLSTSDGKTTFNSNSDDFTSVKDFTKTVLPGIQAKDINANTFTVPKTDAQPGDMMIRTAPHNHIAAYSDVNSPTDVTQRNLVYGNLSGGKPTNLKKTQDWSNSSSGGIKYAPDKKNCPSVESFATATPKVTSKDLL